MKQKTLSLDNLHTVLMFALFAFCIVCILPHNVLCTGLFAEDGASMNALKDVCAAYSHWWPLLQIGTIIIWACTHDKIKETFFKIMLGVLFAYIAANNIDWIIGTANTMISWFGGTGTASSGGSFSTPTAK